MSFGSGQNKIVRGRTSEFDNEFDGWTDGGVGVLVSIIMLTLLLYQHTLQSHVKGKHNTTTPGSIRKPTKEEERVSVNGPA
jgi:hypothetical protein